MQRLEYLGHLSSGASMSHKSHCRHFRIVWIGLALSLLAPKCFAQSLDAGTVVPPRIEGERAMQFRVNLSGTDLGDLKVTIFYAASKFALNNLQSPQVFRGHPVLVRLGN